MDGYSTGGLEDESRAVSAMRGAESLRASRIGEIALMLIKALRQLDVRLAAAADAMCALHGPEASRDLFRGVTLSPSEVAESFRLRPAAPLFGPLNDDGFILAQEDREAGPFGALARHFGLDPFELDVLLIAMAVEVDTRYERLFGFIQDDINLRRPTVETALNLLCSDIDDKISQRERFYPEGRLVGLGLVELDDGRGGGDLLGRAIRVDGSVARFVLAESPVDVRLGRFARVVAPARDAPALPSSMQSLAQALLRLSEGESRPWLYVRLPEASYSDLIASLIATTGRRTVLSVNLSGVTGEEAAALTNVALRVTRMWDYALALENVPDGFPTRLAGLVARDPSVSSPDQTLVVTGVSPLSWAWDVCLPMAELSLPALTAQDRLSLWRTALAAHGCATASPAIEQISEALALGPGVIRAATSLAIQATRQRGEHQPTLDDLSRAARSLLPTAASSLVQRIEPRVTIQDLVLAPAEALRFEEAITLARARERVGGQWQSFGGSAHGRGVLLLFTGPSGTGKTMAAEVLAKALARDLYRLDLAHVVSKFIGETSKHINQVLSDVQAARGVLLIDEADALFGRRSEVRDSHDRYANQEIGYLLQRVETFDGVAVLTTNVPRHLDEAFRRRFTAVVTFPVPDAQCRMRLWNALWPASVQRAPDVQQEWFAKVCELSGAHIRNVIVHASSMASDPGLGITRALLVRAIERECEKLSMPVPEALRAVEPLRRLRAAGP